MIKTYSSFNIALNAVISENPCKELCTIATETIKLAQQNGWKQTTPLCPYCSRNPTSVIILSVEYVDDD